MKLNNRMKQRNFLLKDYEIPEKWNNILAYCLNKPLSMLHPTIKKPAGPDERTTHPLTLNMMRIYSFLTVLFLLWSCNASENRNDVLTIAAAANVQYAMRDILIAFEKETHINTQLVTSSSGKLTAQINEGAPYDIFISADMKYPMSLYESGISEIKPIIYAKGSLVLWSNDERIVPSFEVLKNKEISHIAIGNTKTAPYGKAAEEVLTKLGIIEEIKDKLVYGESISQTTQFINSGAAEIGFTAKSVVLSPQLKNIGNFMEIDPNLHTPIIQGMVPIKNPNLKKETEQSAFIEFMKTPQVRQILITYGYLVD